MLVTLDGMETEFSANAFSKALVPMLVTPLGITTEPEQSLCEVTTLFEIVAVPEVQSIVPLSPS